MDMFFSVSNVALAMSWSLSCLGYLLCICLTWRFLPFLFIHVIPQLFGNRHGFGNFLEHNAVGGRCIFCLYKMFTTATKTHLDHPFRRHGMWNLWLKDFNASLFSIHTALTYAPIILIRVFVYTQVLSYLSLAAACSTASVTDLLLDADESYCPAKLCRRYQLSAAMAFLAWFLSSASCLFNFWLFPSL